MSPVRCSQHVGRLDLPERVALHCARWTSRRSASAYYVVGDAAASTVIAFALRRAGRTDEPTYFPVGRVIVGSHGCWRASIGLDPSMDGSVNSQRTDSSCRRYLAVSSGANHYLPL